MCFEKLFKPTWCFHLTSQILAIVYLYFKGNNFCNEFFSWQKVIGEIDTDI